jgi:hypothetical protein
MTRRIPLAATWAVAFAALAAGSAWGTTYRFEALKGGVTLGEFGYRFVGRERVRECVLEATLKTTSGGPAVRILFDHQNDANYYYAEAADTGCGFVKVEDGVEKRIGTPSEGTLPRGAAAEVSLVRWRQSMRLWLDGRLVAEAYDGTFKAGRVGLGGRSESVAIETVRFQEAGDVRLDDDFMRTAAEEKVWQTVAGDWKPKSLPNASLSANAFMFAGRATEQGKAALAVRGEWFWHDYAASVACRPMSDDAVGLAFYYRGPAQHHLLRWGPVGDGCRLQLLRVAGQERAVLGEARVGFAKGQWYALSVRVIGRRVTAFVDGNPLIEAAEPRLVSGGIGLYCEGAEGALFDDVVVVAPRDFHEDFERPALGKWLELGGTWHWEQGRLDGVKGQGRCLVGAAKTSGRCISGQENWEDYTVAADVLPPVKGVVGLVAYYQDEANCYLFSVGRGEAVLSRVSEGACTELARKPCGVQLATVHRLGFSVRRGVLAGQVDGRVVVQRCDRTLRNGRAGLHLAGGAEAGFDNFSVTFPQRPEPLFTAHSVFAAEESMETWAVRQSDWVAQPQRLGGAEREVQWHRADCPGDVEIQAKIAKLPEGGRVWLVLAGDGKEAADSHAACLERAKGAYRVSLEWRGEAVAKHELPATQPPGLFSAERVGGALLVHLDGKVVLAYDGAAAMPARRIGWAAEGAEVAKDGVDIFTRGVTVYAFHRAPVDWRALSGEWEVTNRWACDPRWSFFAGTRRDDPLVALWNKRDFASDVTLEFAAGIRHDPARGGTAYAYASDINAVLCGDGLDLRNGYSFIFGGWNNQCTRILRDGKTLAETRDIRFPRDSSQHRAWFYFKVQKQGSRLRFFVDNKLALEADDPQPPPGRKVALWTWNNDMMVARVRLSAQGEAPCELPVGPPPPQPHCCYR